jgi:hypothetical protein
MTRPKSRDPNDQPRLKDSMDMPTWSGVWPRAPWRNSGAYPNRANTEKLAQNPARLPTANPLCRKKRRSSIGSLAPSSDLTNQIPNPPAARISSIAVIDSQAIFRPPVMTRVSTDNRKPVRDISPDQSRETSLFFSRNSRKNSQIPAREISPRGRLMKKIHRQEKKLTINPPRVGPITDAIPQMEAARDRVLARWSRGAASVSTTYTRAKIPPDPIP